MRAASAVACLISASICRVGGQSVGTLMAAVGQPPRDWSLLFAAHSQSGTAATIYLVFDAYFGAFPAVLWHDSRQVVEFSHLFHETFGDAARYWG